MASNGGEMVTLFKVGFLLVLFSCTALPSFAQSPPSGVPENAVSFNGHWYLPVYDNSTPQEAAATCDASGGYLAVINSTDEHKFLKTLLKEHPDSRFWLGGKRSEEGNWLWGGGQPMAASELALMSTAAAPLFVALRTDRNQRDLAGIPVGNEKLPVSGFICEWGQTQTFEAPPSSGGIASSESSPITIPDEARQILCVLGKEEDGSPILSTITATGSSSSFASGLQIAVDGSSDDPSLENAANEISTLLSLRHGSGVTGRVMITSEGISAESTLDAGTALAWAVLIDSLITGSSIDPDALLMGDVNADGKTRRAGSTILRFSSLNKKSTRIGIPKADESALSDVLLAGDLDAICGNSISSLATFDEAVAFAVSDEAASEEVKASRAAAAEMRTLYASRADTFLTLLKHPSVQTKLDTILAGIPNAASASLLKSVGMGRGPTNISISGSSYYIHDYASTILETADVYEEYPAGSVRGEEALADEVSQLRYIRKYLDPKTVKLADTFIELGTAFKNQASNPASSTAGKRKFYDEIYPIITNARKESALFSTELLENQL